MSPEEVHKLEVKAGELVIISYGEYSDYEHDGLFKVKRDLNESVLTSVWEEVKEYRTHYEFIRLLIEKGLVSRVEYEELFLGPYDELDLRIRP